MSKNIKIIVAIIMLVIIIAGGFFIYSSFINKNIDDNENKIIQDNKIVNNQTKETKKKIDPSWDLDNDGINDCEKDNTCDDTIDYSLPKKNSSVEDDKKDEKAKILELPETILILDASGSMWGKIGSEAKIEIAKKVVKETVVDFENDMKLGLMVYGQNKKDDCKDIELLSEPALANASNISKIVDGINPKGMTPMGDSVMQAAEFLKYKEKKATVVLVSDGIETCGVDLCKLGKTLEETGVDFTAHVIGFGMTEKQTAGLKCLADETGGKFVSAKDSKSLSDALREAIEKASCSKEKLGEAKFNIPEKLSVNSEIHIKWSGVDSRKGDAIGIFKKGETNWNRHLDSELRLDDKSKEVKLMTPIEQGEYEVIYFANCGSILGRKSFSVGEVGAKVNFPETATVGSEVEFSWEGPNNKNDVIGIFKKGETNWNKHFSTIYYLNSKNNTGKIKVPVSVGDYDVVYWLGGEKILARKTFKTIKATANFIEVPSTVKKDEKFSIKWEGVDLKGDAITILPKNSSNWNDHIGGSIYYLNSKKGQGELMAPNKVGDYDIIYWLQQKKILAKKTIRVID